MKCYSKLLKASAIAGSAFVMVACSTVDDKQLSEVDELRDRYEMMAQKPEVVEYVPLALETAEDSLVTLENYVKNGKDDDLIDHQAKVTSIRLDTVEQSLKYNISQQYIDNAESKRNEILIQARTNEAIEAERKARKMEMRAKNAEARAENLEESISDISNKANQLQQEVSKLEAKETSRGVVLTLKDILFETNKSELMPGQKKTLQQISEFLKEYPDRELVVEGHTDSTGEASYNKQLSYERANAVKSALTQYGVKGARIKSKGMGEEFPVATNKTDEGRQLNRRVDIVIERVDGEIAAN